MGIVGVFGWWGSGTANTRPLTVQMVPESTFSSCSHRTRPWSTVRAAVREKAGEPKDASAKKRPHTHHSSSPDCFHSPGGSEARAQVLASPLTRCRVSCTRAWHSRSFSARTSLSLVEGRRQ